jgi:hypothetical protein
VKLFPNVVADIKDASLVDLRSHDIRLELGDVEDGFDVGRGCLDGSETDYPEERFNEPPQLLVPLTAEGQGVDHTKDRFHDRVAVGKLLEKAEQSGDEVLFFDEEDAVLEVVHQHVAEDEEDVVQNLWVGQASQKSKQLVDYLLRRALRVANMKVVFEDLDSS